MFSKEITKDTTSALKRIPDFLLKTQSDKKEQNKTLKQKECQRMGKRMARITTIMETMDNF